MGLFSAGVLRGVFGALMLLFVASCAYAQARDSEPMPHDLIHADLPLFGAETETMWPQSFAEAEDFGCISRVAFGDWALRQTGDASDDDAEWYRVSNYGVFHCFANVGTAGSREDLDHEGSSPAFFVLFGATRVAGKDLELWALQIGARPGSDYLLLTREPGDGVVQSFNVLQTECPSANRRRGRSLSILITSYCALNSRSELLRLARRMAQRPPFGTLSLVAAVDQD